ncbi:probable methyltransferase-like protein 24 isoform X2 [Haliotis rufescens]|uniref:probable methyltransferase-like protein 24 isoform X2 n=1 Tax=Haliotis rufescens TaxID=6454 RepID=UPI00201F4A33|nr:probable methyltransferase-like protein 24 isoform X2 [Haliotis rufescens]
MWRLTKLVIVSIILMVFAMCGYVIMQKSWSSHTIQQSQNIVYIPKADTGNGDCQRGHVLPTKPEIRKLDVRQMANLYHSYVENIQVACGDMKRMGLQQDGGWEVCDDPLVRPKKPCLVYSFGINNDFSFDDEMAREYKCEIHSFDPSMGRPDHRHGDHVMFHSLGLAEYNGKSSKQWPMKTLADIRQSLNHEQTTIDVLKIDIEDMEWRVFPEMIKSNALHNVTQFVFEVHITLKKVDAAQAKYFTALEIFRDLYDLGYRIFFTHRNKWCHYKSKLAGKQRTSCHEVFMMKVC